MAKPVRFYAFLDVAVDVFYSIILYNAFMAFPGFTVQAFLMVFAVFVMINYWWDARSDVKMPKYYLGDFYFITVIMFVFSQWPGHFGSVREFLRIAATFFLVDALYAIAAVYMHKEKIDERNLWFWFKAEIVLAVVYGIYSFAITSVNAASAALIFIPYIIFFGVNIKKGIFKFKFINSGNEPY